MEFKTIAYYVYNVRARSANILYRSRIEGVKKHARTRVCILLVRICTEERARSRGRY